MLCVYTNPVCLCKKILFARWIISWANVGNDGLTWSATYLKVFLIFVDIDEYLVFKTEYVIYARKSHLYWVVDCTISRKAVALAL